MRRIKHILVKHANGNEHSHEKDNEHTLPYEHSANKLMASTNGYAEYVGKYGYHFTEALAEHISKMMENGNGQSHMWTCAQVEKALGMLGLNMKESKTGATIGDITYLANMYYADLHPDPIREEIGCVRAAYRVAHDVDGYSGMIFCRWTADAIGKSLHISWDDYI